ncbi:TPD1 protein homolog 1 [Selaginella moellendorffii]|uniref:TPD1 protein homolog 1 n=1 Tax=Selaginella moellendorffii TaxID=88036 RepID=UPI000D1C6FA7|nr:TPD1 protein homolog 1 [Selaginella moellendorffii]|eukprot:XP_002961118.2 TPD1 protein homolog 1 [Selaginella moellendorffii]
MLESVKYLVIDRSMPRLVWIQAVLVFLLIIQLSSADESPPELLEISQRNSTVESASWSRRLLASQLYSRKRRNLGTNRISDECTKSDISVFQGRSSPLPNGIPTYSVQIINLCVVGCPLSNIHIACGWFASAKLVNPKIFKRVGYNDCIVNDGKAISGGESIFFHYANSFQYPLRVQSAVSCSSGV